MTNEATWGVSGAIDSANGAHLDGNDILAFAEYCHDWYGQNGVYDMGADMAQIFFAIYCYLKDNETPFEGDSFDREQIRAVLESKFGLTEKVQEPYPVPEDHGMFTLSLKPA